MGMGRNPYTSHVWKGKVIVIYKYNPFRVVFFHSIRKYDSFLIDLSANKAFPKGLGFLCIENARNSGALKIDSGGI